MLGISRNHVLPVSFFFFNDTATTEIYTLSLHDALPISSRYGRKKGALSPLSKGGRWRRAQRYSDLFRSEEHTSELQSQSNLVCRLLLEKKKTDCPLASRRRVLTYLHNDAHSSGHACRNP